MQSFFAYALALSSLASAAVIPPHGPHSPPHGGPHHLVCGSETTALCANSTRAVGPLKVAEGEYVKNQFSYINYPGVSTWKECKAACHKTFGCRSFQYYFDQSDLEVGPSFQCNLLYKPAKEYAVPCSNATDIAPMNTYFDAECHAPPQLHSGLVAEKNETICNSNRTILYPEHLYRDQMKAANVTQTECKQMCKDTKGCKSYWYTEFGAGSFNPRYAVESHYPTANGGNTTNIDDLVQNAVCILISQRVKEYSVDDGNIFTYEFFDLNCPVSEE